MRCWTRVTGNSATFGDKKYGDCLLQGNTFFLMSAHGLEYVWDIMIKMPRAAIDSARTAIADRPPASVSAMKRLEAFEVVPTSVVPEGVRVLPSRWVFKIKPDKFKARICVRGDLQPLSQAGDTFSPTLKFVTVRLLFALAALYGFDLCQMDVCNAFVNAAPVEVTYMHAPQGFSTSGFCWRLLKALYGLKGSIFKRTCSQSDCKRANSIHASSF